MRLSKFMKNLKIILDIRRLLTRHRTPENFYDRVFIDLEGNPINKSAGEE